jgi:urease accessory protein
MATGIEASQLLLLLTWMSPAFPTGQFAYSHGLEWAIESGAVRDGETLVAWVSDLVTRGSGWNDAVLFSRCWDEDAGELNELALALAGSRERYLETTQIGRSFGIAASVFSSSTLRMWGRGQGEGAVAAGETADVSLADAPPHPALSPAEAGARNKGGSAGADDVAYPIAAGAACVAMGLPKEQALLAYLQGFAAALTSVAVRLVPIGQTAGLESLRALMPVIAETAERAAGAVLDDLGSITLLSDIAAMKHETQYSRVFRT